jgi:hypothetical protein
MTPGKGNRDPKSEFNPSNSGFPGQWSQIPWTGHRRPTTRFPSQLRKINGTGHAGGPRPLLPKNVIRHGILAESVEHFYKVLSTLQEELQPVTSIQSRYAETMALAEWRQKRLICLEKEQFVIEAERQERADRSTVAEDSAIT